MKQSYFILICLVFFMMSCNNDKSNKTTTVAAEKPAAVPAQKEGDALTGYPSLTQAALMNIWDNGEMIDYIFHDLPFSMNQTELQSIRTNLTYIDPKPLNAIPKHCKPFARQFYQVGGDIVLESDVYFSEGCEFYVFWEDGKPKYGNMMADSGKNFFNSMVKQAMQAR